MRRKSLIASILVLLSMAAFVAKGRAAEFNAQGKEETRLSPRYRVFLAETRMFMTDKEKDVFLKLRNDRDRDIFIEAFWKQRGGRQREIRANINLLRLMRMVQVLELTEDQIAKILPVMNQIEKGKQELQSNLQIQMRELRLLLRDETPDEEKLAESLASLRQLRKTLREKEAEFEKFLSENLSLVQQAEYVVFSQEFYRGLQEKLSRARTLQERNRRRIKRQL
ncbi:MAG: hypothetical protein PVF22_02250 [Candidatus Aminicenantes bacterium]|jgi:Spy/CpxP family protein refolding chaperone